MISVRLQVSVLYFEMIFLVAEQGWTRSLEVQEVLWLVYGPWILITFDSSLVLSLYKKKKIKTLSLVFRLKQMPCYQFFISFVLLIDIMFQTMKIACIVEHNR